eukprot:jgi/Astpho2/7147/Aster-01473
MRQPVGRAAGKVIGFFWQGRTLLCKPQRGAGLCMNQCIFIIIVKLIKAPPWTGGLLLPCPLQDVKAVVDWAVALDCQVASDSGKGANVLIPTAAIVSCPLQDCQDCQVASHSCLGAGLPGGRLWLRLSTCPGSNGSQFGAAIAATRGLPEQQLGGACREATVKTYLQALWHPATS